jgi:hypothetical protein
MADEKVCESVPFEGCEHIPYETFNDILEQIVIDEGAMILADPDIYEACGNYYAKDVRQIWVNSHQGESS